MRATRTAMAAGLCAIAAGTTAAFMVAGAGGYDEWTARASGGKAPRWTQPCLHRARQTGVQLRCAQLRGRVVLRYTEDRASGSDVHLVVLADRRLRFAKVIPRDRVAALPAIGDRVDVVGEVVTGRSLRKRVRALRIADRGL